MAPCLGLRKREVLAVKKVKSSLSSSRLQYPLLMLLLLVMDGVGTALTVMETVFTTAAPGRQAENFPEALCVLRGGRLTKHPPTLTV